MSTTHYNVYRIVHRIARRRVLILPVAIVIVLAIMISNFADLVLQQSVAQATGFSVLWYGVGIALMGFSMAAVVHASYRALSARTALEVLTAAVTFPPRLALRLIGAMLLFMIIVYIMMLITFMMSGLLLTMMTSITAQDLFVAISADETGAALHALIVGEPNATVIIGVVLLVMGIATFMVLIRLLFVPAALVCDQVTVLRALKRSFRATRSLTQLFPVLMVAITPPMMVIGMILLLPPLPVIVFLTSLLLALALAFEQMVLLFAYSGRRSK